MIVELPQLLRNKKTPYLREAFILVFRSGFTFGASRSLGGKICVQLDTLGLAYPFSLHTGQSSISRSEAAIILRPVALAMSALFLKNSSNAEKNRKLSKALPENISRHQP